MLRSDAAKRLRGFTPLPFLHQRQPEAVQTLGRTRIQFHGAAKVYQRGIQIAARLKRHAELEVRNGERRPESGRDSKLFDPLVEVPELLECQAEVVPGFRMLRAEAHRRAKGLDRAFQVLGPPSRRTEVVVRVEQSGVELDGNCELVERFFDA